MRKGGDNDLVKRASLLQRDSVHGPFPGTVTVDEENQQIIANGTRIQVIYADSPDAVDATYADLVGAGHEGHLEPWDAFWGQRYAVVHDPDGNTLSLDS